MDAHPPERRADRSGRPAPRRDRGAALVEAAFVAPIFFVMIFGVLEFGFAFLDRLTAQNMSEVGARAASGFGDDPLADHKALNDLASQSAGIPGGRITDIVIYEASGPGDSVPMACLGGSQPNTCNRYTGAHLGLAEDRFGCDDSDDVDQAWCPTDRKTALTGSNGPPDYVGVYVRITHPTITKFFGDEWVFTSNTVMRIEPRTLS